MFICMWKITGTCISQYTSPEVMNYFDANYVNWSLLCRLSDKSACDVILDAYSYLKLVAFRNKAGI